MAHLKTLLWFFCCYFPAYLFQKFHFQLTKKKLERRPGKGRHFLADGITALAQLYALYSDRAHSFNQ